MTYSRVSPTEEDVKVAVEVHSLALDCAVEVQSRCASAEESKSLYLVTRAALSSLYHEVICLHRAVKDLSFQGWAFATPILLRTMLDILCSMIVIAENEHPDVAAFHYFYSWTKDDIATSLPRAVEQAKRDIDQHLGKMLPEDRSLAVQWLDTPTKGSYWFSAFFNSPTQVIRGSAPRVLELYRWLSSTSHGGFLGVRLFRDEPDRFDVNPRKDPASTGRAILYSSRILAEASRMRAIFTGLEYDCYRGVVEACIGMAAPFGLPLE